MSLIVAVIGMDPSKTQKARVIPGLRRPIREFSGWCCLLFSG
jgi:hypothetical protein